MRIGILGGTFNPIHCGHVAIADAARHAFGLSEVWFMPSAGPPHKSQSGTVSAEHRTAMVELAVSELTWASVCRLELERGGVSYAFDTVKMFRERYPELDPWFIIGMDSLLELHLWYRGAELLDLCEFGTLMRPGYVEPPSAMALGVGLEAGERLVRNIRRGPLVAASSTEIRESVRCGDALADGLVAPAVGEYIRSAGLYR